MCVADCQLARFGRGWSYGLRSLLIAPTPSEPQNEPDDGGDKENQHDNP